MKQKISSKIRIVQLFIILAMGILSPIMVYGGYVVKAVKGDVKIIKQGNAQKLNVGSSLTAADMLDIAQGAEVEIMNDVSKTIYTSTKSGRTTVSRMMLDAKTQAGDNLGNVNRQMRFGGGHSNKDARVYVETGMVKRAMTNYDPDASGIEIDPESMGGWLAAVFQGKGNGKDFPAKISTTPSSAEVKKEFSISNDGDYPIYFNVFRVKNDCGTPEVEISEFGQPSGCYVLFPGHALDRKTMREPEAGEIYIVGAPCLFDIEATLEALNKKLHSTGEEGVMIDMPVYTKKL